jgi:hypothetical protein
LESNASSERVAAYADDLEKRRERPPKTRGERAIRFFFAAFGHGILWLSFVMVGAVAWVTTAPGGWHSIAIFAAKMAGFVLAASATAYGGGWFFQQQLDKVGTEIARAKVAESRWGLVGEAEQIARRAARTNGFALLAIGVFLQIPLAWSV